MQSQPSHYRIVAAADIVAHRASRASSDCGATAYGSLEAMLRAESLDLAILLTPSGLHPRQARQCAEAGVACLSEKPFGCNYDEARKAVAFCETLGVPLFVVLQCRFTPVLRAVKQWVEGGRLGKLFMLQINLFWHRSQAYYEGDSWRGTRELDGGVLMNQGSHYVDLLQWLGGKVASAKGELGTLSRDIECEDTGAAVIRFASGAIGLIASTVLAHAEDHETRLTILAEHATLVVGGRYLDKLLVCKAADPLVAAAHPNDFAATTGYGHEAFYAELPIHLASPASHDAITGREGLKSLRILEILYAR